MADNWLQQELAAEKAAQDTAATIDQPGYDYAQTQPLEALAMGDKSHREIAGIVRMLMRTDLQHEAVCLAARDRIAWLAARVEELETALRLHHERILNNGTIGLPDGKGGWIEIDDPAEYGDSSLYEKTMKALHPLKTVDPGSLDELENGRA